MNQFTAINTLGDINLPLHALTDEGNVEYTVDVKPTKPVSERVLRPRVSVTAKENTNVLASQLEKSKKRPSTALAQADVDVKPALKKPKVEEKKASLAVRTTRKVDVDAARRRWVRQHSHLFTPLLPSHTTRVIFEEVAGDLPYVPRYNIDEQPCLIKGGEMKDYQLQGLSFFVWMYQNGMNCILGDEMGLGKTLQTLSLFAHIKENANHRVDPHLIVCPLSVLSSWMAEIARWLPSFRAMQFHGQVSERNRLKDVFSTSSASAHRAVDIVVTTYESFTSEQGWFKSQRWTYCVLDEGHRIKNSGSELSKSVQGIGSIYENPPQRTWYRTKVLRSRLTIYRLILTGTPLQNNLFELWSLLHWLYPFIFTPATERLFRDSFDLSQGKYNMPFLQSAQKLLSTIMLRRTKASVEIQVPPREEITVFLPLSEAQRFWTYRLITRIDSLSLQEIFPAKLENAMTTEGHREVQQNIHYQIQQSQTGENNKWKKLMNLLMQLRQVCDHPYLMEDAEPNPYYLGEHLVFASTKMIIIDKILKDILPKKEKALIFSQFTGMLDLMEDFLNLRGINFLRLDGSTPRPRRTLNIKLFQQDNDLYPVFLVSTKAGGLGINLTKATHVIMCDSDWNPQNDLQAIARAHRIGQTKTVKVYRLICHGSVEDQMLDRIRRKLFLSVKVMGSDSDEVEQNQSLKLGELLKILRRGSSALEESNPGMDFLTYIEKPLDEILQMSIEREKARLASIQHDANSGAKKEEDDKDLLATAEEEERALLSGVAAVKSRVFEGRNLAAQSNKDIADEWTESQKRARDNRIVQYNGIQHVINKPEQLRIPPPPKRSRSKYEHEDWCIYCRDGGDLICCSYCPRVLHKECHGHPVRHATVSCPQHSCSRCDRKGTDVGGMLFRCQTCPQAFCEDCLPEGELCPVGDTLPEFEVLGYGGMSSAFYIRCQDCLEYFRENPRAWQEWQDYLAIEKAKLDSVRESQ